jgi:hypothetical protein
VRHRGGYGCHQPQDEIRKNEATRNPACDSHPPGSRFQDHPRPHLRSPHRHPTFRTMTGAPAEISPDLGGAFSLFGARIVGRNIELVPRQRLVQAWRSQGWAIGAWSIRQFRDQGAGSGNPPHSRPHRLPRGFGGIPEDPDGTKHYWEPLKKFFA